MPSAKVLLVDDHQLVLESVRQLLESHFTIVGAVHNAGDLMRTAQELRPDVVVLDIRMPDMSGFAATKELKRLLPAVKVIFLTMLTEAVAISEAFRSGASAYVVKHAAGEELRAAITHVLASNRVFLSSHIAEEVREAMEDQWMRPNGYSSDLTARQREVLVMAANGASSKEISQALNISMKTVEFHKGRITHKLGIHTASELTKFALAQGLITLEPS